MRAQRGLSLASHAGINRWYSWCDNIKASQGNSFNVVLIPGKTRQT